MEKDDIKNYQGLGNSNYSEVLPSRIIPKTKKQFKAFKKNLLDQLEVIGLKQFEENQEYVDYFKMQSGELVYADLMDGEGEVLRSINEVREELELYTWLRHYDFIGDVCNTLLGEWLLQKDKFRFDTVDEVTTNEYIREATDMLNKYAQAKFNAELQRKFVQMGIDPDEQFETPEEQEQYIQALEAQANEFLPERIRDKMRNFKTLAANWAQKTYERDHQRFRMDLIEAEEALSKILVGKAPRHFLVGWDYYKPETWSPINTFYSKDIGAKFYQECEFVGRVHFFSPSEILSRYGHKITSKESKEILESFSGKFESSTGGGASIKGLAKKNFNNPVVEPFKGAQEYSVMLQFQDAFNTPLGTMTTPDGRTANRWLPHFNSNYNMANSYATSLVVGEKIRNDLIQVLEVYVECYKEVGLMTYRTETGYLDVVEVDTELLEDFIKENNIKKVKTVSFEEAMKNPEENTIVYGYKPVVYSGLKINTSGTFGGKDIYFLEELEYQLTNNSEFYEPMLPVFGHIGKGVAPLLRPYQIDYNWVMNQNKNLLEKELGIFLVMDVNFLPTEFMDLTDNGENALAEMYNIIKDIGILPIDASKSNLSEKGGVNFNTLMAQNVTFTPQIQRNLELASFYKREALTRIGITPTREGAPTSYETATGVRVSQNAGYSKTMTIFQELLYDKQSKIEGHLAIAQYCQMNQKDSGHLYRAGDDEILFLETIQEIDPDFSARKIGVYPVMDITKKINFENLKTVLLQRNTMEADEFALAELLYSDDYLELKEAALNLRKYNEQRMQVVQEQENERHRQQLEQEEMQHLENLELEYAKLDNRLEVERIEQVGRVASSSQGRESVNEVHRAADRQSREQIAEADRDVEIEKLRQNYEDRLNNFQIKLEELKLKRQQLRVRENERRTKEFTSIINKN